MRHIHLFNNTRIQTQNVSPIKKLKVKSSQKHTRIPRKFKGNAQCSGRGSTLAYIYYDRHWHLYWPNEQVRHAHVHTRVLGYPLDFRFIFTLIFSGAFVNHFYFRSFQRAVYDWGYFRLASIHIYVLYKWRFLSVGECVCVLVCSFFIAQLFCVSTLAWLPVCPTDAPLPART